MLHNVGLCHFKLLTVKYLPDASNNSALSMWNCDDHVVRPIPK